MVTPFNPFPKLIGVVNPGPWAIYFRDSKPNKNGTLCCSNVKMSP
jgi:hypothetical protein